MSLDDRQLTTYLANVIHIARADGTLSSHERAALESIRAATGAKKRAYCAAEQSAEAPTYSVLPTGTFAAKVANLEDMLRVALSDGDLSRAEQVIIEGFAKAIGVSDAQLETIRSEVVAELGSAPVAAACARCDAPLSQNARFCPNCGSAVAAFDEPTLVTYEIPSSGCAIEFAESTAASFQDALATAKASPGFQTCTKGKKSWYLAAYSKEDFSGAVKLASLLGGMRNRRAFLDGQEIGWDELFGFIWCASQRTDAYRPPHYCFGKEDNRLNPWGCKNADLEWTEWADWFSFGKWESPGLLRKANVFVFDKDRIRHEVQSNLHRFRYCPHMQPKLIDAVLAAMPDRIEVEKSRDWKYAENYDERPGSIRIKQVEKSDGFSVTNEFWADGVRPQGLAALRDVLTSAFQAAGIDAGVLKGLTS